MYKLGYTIQYGSSGKAESAWNSGRRKYKKRITAVVLLAVLCAGLLLSGGAEKLKNLIIPGDPEVTKAAFAQFTEDIRQGERVGDAITAFCREIIDNAVIQE